MRIDRAVWAGLAVVLLWASAFPAIQVAAPALGVVGLSVVRLAVAAVALLLVAAVARIRPPRLRDLGWVVAAGFFGMTAYQLLLNESELHVPAGTASILVAAAPLVSVAVARVLFGERTSPLTIAGGAVALGGVVIVCLSRAGVSLTAAVWIAVAAMIVQGIYHPLQRPLLRTRTGLEVATYTMVAGTLMTLPLVPFGWEALLTAPASGWVAAVYLGLLPSAAGFVLWGYAVGRLPVALSTSLLYLVPPVAVLLAWIWLGDAPVPMELLGGAVVISGVVLISQGPRLARRIRAADPEGRLPRPRARA
ncbi:DMT family transporter [Leifsonia poae]|uniref:DMT family transporter n=1 Tax=Leifsonia poae TaxID=110933 RepID=UPI003D68D140